MLDHFGGYDYVEQFAIVLYRRVEILFDPLNLAGEIARYTQDVYSRTRLNRCEASKPRVNCPVPAP